MSFSSFIGLLAFLICAGLAVVFAVLTAATAICGHYNWSYALGALFVVFFALASFLASNISDEEEDDNDGEENKEPEKPEGEMIK